MSTFFDKVGRTSNAKINAYPTTAGKHAKNVEKEVITAVDDNAGLPKYEEKGFESASAQVVRDTTHRRLKARHIQLIGIGGTIGTALYVSIGNGLIHGGPASLFIAFTIWYVSPIVSCNEYIFLP